MTTVSWIFGRIMTMALIASAIVNGLGLIPSAQAESEHTLLQLNPDEYNLLVNSFDPLSESCHLDARKSVPFRFVQTLGGEKLVSLSLRVVYPTSLTVDSHPQAHVKLIASTAERTAAYVVQFATSVATADTIWRKWGGPGKESLFRITEDPACVDEARGIHLVTGYSATYE
jgi:hypothetical protein